MHTVPVAGRSVWQQARVACAVAVMAGSALVPPANVTTTIPASAVTASPTPTWSRLSPATNPPARAGASMAYDPATGNMVLFGGFSSSDRALGTPGPGTARRGVRRPRRTSPSARISASMAYDPATGDVVLFGGTAADFDPLGDTWTWNGTTWTQQSPATSPPARSPPRWPMTRPPAAWSCSGAGRRQRPRRYVDMERYQLDPGVPATSPSARIAASMAYDPATWEHGPVRGRRQQLRWSPRRYLDLERHNVDSGVPGGKSVGPQRPLDGL